MELNYRNQRFVKLYSFLDKLEAWVNPGVLLLLVALITIIIANSPLREWYESIWKIKFFLGGDGFNLFSHQGHSLTTLQMVNDALMAVFFFLVGLEIKREMLVGELSSFKQAILPIIAACGGMIFPVIVFFFVSKLYGFSPIELRGIAIPMATDIAFSIGVLGLLGKRIPISLKIFLLALAIVDDIGGIVVIAVFYSTFTTASFVYLLVSVVLFAILLLGNYLRINSKLFYAIIGIAIWYLFLQAGIHPTIAGVLVAFTVPARPHINVRKFTEGIQQDLDILRKTVSEKGTESIVLTNRQVKYLSRIETAADHVVSPLQDFEDNLEGVVNYFIMPLFAFANAGVFFNWAELNMFSGVTVSVLLGLLVGKVTGIFSFTWLAVKFRVSRLSTGMTWRNLFGLSLLGGIGFTVALFLAGLSYPLGSELLNQAKLGVVLGSLFSGMLGYFVLRMVFKKK